MSQTLASSLPASGHSGTSAVGRHDARTACMLCVLAIAMLSLTVARTAQAQCLPDPPLTGDTVTCSGTSTGFEAPVDVDDLTVTVETGATLDESDALLDAAIAVNDGNTITVEAGATIDITEDGGIGILAGDNNQMAVDGTINVTGSGGIGVFAGEDNEIVFESGELNVMVDGGRGILMGGSSTDPTSTSTIFVEPTATITLMSDDAIGIESTGDSALALQGVLNLDGLNGRGLVLGNRVDFSKINPALSSGVNIGIQMEGTLNIGDGTAATAGGIGLVAGDGWFPNDIGGTETDPDFSDSTLTNAIIANFPTGILNVNSIDGFGMRLGDDANVAGNHNSVAFNGGEINVMATGAIGVSVGGNDFAIPSDPSATLPYSFRNTGSITGTGDHGALVEFRHFSTGENRMVNSPGASILADAAFLGMPSGAIAVMGTDGVERISNGGSISGNVLLGGGDDFFEMGGRGSFEGTLDGQLGNDSLVLLDNQVSVTSFDVSQLVNFEMIRVGGGNGWSLENAAGFNAPVQIDPGGRLVVVDPTTLGGDLIADPTGFIEAQLDQTAALTVSGDATFAGTLIVSPAPGLPVSPTPYLLIDVVGSRTGTFSSLESPPFTSFSQVYVGDDLFITFDVQGFELEARTPNQTAVARHFTEISNDGGATGELAQLLDDLESAATMTSIASTFDSFSPEAYDAQTSILVESGRQVTRMLFDRPRECRQGAVDPWAGFSKPLPCHGRKWSPWLATLGSFRSREKYVDHPRYDAQMAGLIVGIDAQPIEDLDLTFAISSQRGSVDVAGAETSTLTLTDMSGHAAYRYGPLRIQSSVGWGHGFHRDRRQFVFPDSLGNPIGVTAEEEHDSDRISLGAEASVQIEAGPVQIEPIVTLDWAWVYQRPISEGNVAGLGLIVDRRDDQVGSISSGFRVSTTYHHTAYLAEQLEWMDGIWRPQFDIRWREVLTGTEREIDARLRGAPAGVSDFTVEGLEDDGGFEVGAAVSFTPKDADRLQFDLRYEAFVASHTLEQDLSLRVRIGF